MTTERLDPLEVEAFTRAREDVQERIAAAATRSGRDPDSVTLVAVSKTVPASRVRTAVAGGFTTLGENRVQEGAAKIPEVPGATWHLIGPVQGNKARRAIELFDVIESVHSEELAVRLSGIASEAHVGRPVSILLQVNVDLDPAKAGFSPDSLRSAMDRLVRLPALDVLGLMTIGRLTADPAEARATFSALRELSGALRRTWPGLGPALSMGMSDDYELAVEEGATIVRVGRAIFGDRTAAPAGSR